MNKTIDQILDHYAQFNQQKRLMKKQIIRDHQFHIDQKFQVIDKIGKGSFSIVVAAICNDSECLKNLHNQKQVKQNLNHIIAIKKMQNIFTHLTQTKKALRQLKAYRLLKHPNILELHTIQLPVSKQNFYQIYCIFQIMDTNLQRVLQQSDLPLNEEHWKFFIYQILRALKYLHSAGVIHGNLSAKACLVNDICDLKLCQFSQLSLVSNPQRLRILNQNFEKIKYPAPQLLLKDKNFDTSIDIWSVGCIFAEIIYRKPLFNRSNIMLQLYCDYVGNPSQNTFSQLSQQSKILIKNLKKHHRQPKNFNKIFPLLSQKGVNLLQKMLVFQKQKRITAQEALKHPYFYDIHSQEHQPIRQQLQDLIIQFDFQKYLNLETQQYKKLLLQQILLYHNKNIQKEHHIRVKRKQSLMTNTTDKNYKYQQKSQNLKSFIQSLVDKGIKQQQKLFLHSNVSLQSLKITNKELN